MFALSASFELTVTTRGKSWMSETDLQVPCKAPALQYLYICARGRRQRNGAELKQKTRCVQRLSFT